MVNRVATMSREWLWLELVAPFLQSFALDYSHSIGRPCHPHFILFRIFIFDIELKLIKQRTRRANLTNLTPTNSTRLALFMPWFKSKSSRTLFNICLPIKLKSSVSSLSSAPRFRCCLLPIHRSLEQYGIDL